MTETAMVKLRIKLSNSNLKNDQVTADLIIFSVQFVEAPLTYIGIRTFSVPGTTVS